nr:hypothetical protein HUO10_003599 [Paraburkholderia busanensis]
MPDTIPTLNITISKGFRKLPDGNTLGFWPESDGVVMQEWQGQDGKGDLLSQETYDYGKYAQYRTQHPDLKLPDLSAPKTGNTVGKVVGETSVTLPTITVTANPPPKPETATEVGFWGAVGGWVHGGLDAAGLIPGLGAVPDLLNAGIYAAEGDFVNAGISAVAAIPVVGDAALAGKYAVKGGELAVKESEKIAAREAEKIAAKQAEEKAAKELAEKETRQAEKDAEKSAGEEASKPPSGKDGGKVKGGPCDHLKQGSGKGPYRGGAHSKTSKPANDGKDSHHMPADDVSPLKRSDGPAIQMDPDDHAATSSNGQNGNLGKTYRNMIKGLLQDGKWREAMLKEILDVRRIAAGIDDPRKYNEAMLEMLEYFKCLEKNGLLPMR